MPMYNFAWVEDTETEFVVDDHARVDEDVFSYDLEQTEGDFAVLTVVIRNPRVGLLAPGRKVWAWFSRVSADMEVTPMFFGRLVGVPTDINLEFVTLQFSARP